MSTHKNNTAQTQTLPASLWLTILNFLEPEDWIALSEVSKTWFHLTNETCLWEKIGFFNRPQFKKYLQNAMEITEKTQPEDVLYVCLLGNASSPRHKLFCLPNEGDYFARALLTGFWQPKRSLWLMDKHVQFVNAYTEEFQQYSNSNNTVYLVCLSEENESDSFWNLNNESTFHLFVLPEDKNNKEKRLSPFLSLRKDDTLSSFTLRLMEKIQEMNQFHLPKKVLPANQHKRCVIL